MFKEKLKPFINRHNEITVLLSSPDIASDISRMTELSKEQSGLNELVEKANTYIETADAIEENKELLGDAELGDLAKEELLELEPMLPELESEIKILMLPTDKNDDKNIMMTRIFYLNSEQVQVEMKPHCLLQMSSVCIPAMQSRPDGK